MGRHPTSTFGLCMHMCTHSQGFLITLGSLSTHLNALPVIGWLCTQQPSSASWMLGLQTCASQLSFLFKSFASLGSKFELFVWAPSLSPFFARAPPSQFPHCQVPDITSYNFLKVVLLLREKSMRSRDLLHSRDLLLSDLPINSF